MSTINCAGCIKDFKAGKGLRCFLCNHWYDLLCANISEKRFKLMHADTKNAWKCPGCLNKQPKIDNTNTPVRPARQSSPVTQPSPVDGTNVTQRNKPPICHSPDRVNDTLLADITTGSLREMIRHEINQALHDTIAGLIHEQVSVINNMISEFKQSLSFFNEKYEEIKVTLEDKTAKIHMLEKESCVLQNSLRDVTKRMNLLEQHARSSNIELQCVPEYRSENLTSTIFQLGKIIECDIKDTDIQLCTRVAKKDTRSARPRSILVKFNSPRLRDSFLAASIQFNKANSKNKLNSSHLGIANEKPVPIFVVEHLSPENKALHAATRVRAKELGYRFVWVRNGRVLLKKDETAQSVVVEDFEKLKSLT